MHSPQTLEDRRDFLARCTRCSQCKFIAMPKSQRHASACPSIDYGQFHAYSGGGQLIMAYGLLDGNVPHSAEMAGAVASCTMCGNCDVSCKINFAETVEPLDSLYALRAKLVSDGHSPAPHREMMEALHRSGNSRGHPRTERAHWADGLAFDGTGKAETLLHIGSGLAYEPAGWPALRAVVATLHRVGIAMTHLGTEEGSSGGLAFDLGYVDEARTLAQELIEQAQQTGAGTLVTFSAAALSAFRSIHPRFGLSFGSIRVLHITEYLWELVQQGRLSLAPLPDLQGRPVAYHDSCKLGRLSEPRGTQDSGLDNQMSGILVSRTPSALRFGNGGCYEAPRALLRAMGVELVELERHHASSYCCGACGGVKETVPEAAALAARNRLAEVQDSTASILVSACTGCTSHLAEHAGSAVQMQDLLGLLAQALRPAPALAG
ncbi:(Fe-S)-binding protein [Azospirillum sp. B506]|uniref:(Fe-S)-binding protein n=1 Tax=Azospirillum sp. B506 TaxID=137721 RepID=UPI00034B448C|nr:(Fe-S)-binding protein [Azospirillum sp. B506]